MATENNIIPGVPFEVDDGTYIKSYMPKIQSNGKLGIVPIGMRGKDVQAPGDTDYWNAKATNLEKAYIEDMQRRVQEQALKEMLTPQNYNLNPPSRNGDISQRDGVYENRYTSRTQPLYDEQGFPLVQSDAKEGRAWQRPEGQNTYEFAPVIGQPQYATPQKQPVEISPMDKQKEIAKQVMKMRATGMYSEEQIKAWVADQTKVKPKLETWQDEQGKKYTLDTNNPQDAAFAKENNLIKAAHISVNSVDASGVKVLAQQTIDGAIPPIAPTSRNMKFYADYIKEIYTQNPGFNLKVANAAYKGDMAEIINLQKQRGQILAFENTANANADLALTASKAVDRTGIPAFNKWLLAGKKSIAGDENVAKFDLAVRTFINEYARVTTTVTGGGITSDTARKEIEQVINLAQTFEQFEATINLAKQEMQNRRLGYEKQLDETFKRVGGQSPTPAPQTGQTTKIKMKDGSIQEFDSTGKRIK